MLRKQLKPLGSNDCGLVKVCTIHRIVTLPKYVPSRMLYYTCMMGLHFLYMCISVIFRKENIIVNVLHTHASYCAWGYELVEVYYIVRLIMFACLWAMRDIDSIKLIISVHDVSDTHTHTHTFCVCVCVCVCARMRMLMWEIEIETQFVWER